MKRSPMPPRRTPLAQGKPLQRTTPLHSAPTPRSGGPKRKTANRPAPPKHIPNWVRNLIRARSEGLCEVGLACRGTALGVDSAHREGKKIGGTGKEWSNMAANLLWSCRQDHVLIDDRMPGQAANLGLKLREGVARPWEVPVQHARYGWVLLDDQGGHRPAPEGSHAPGRRPTPVVACTEQELVQQDGAFIEAMERYGHLQCPGWSAPLPGPFTCGCGSTVFYVEEVG